MQATNLKTNHLTQPLGIDAGTLFLSWQCAEGVRQTAYEIEVTAGAETLWASGKALGSVMHTETPIAVPPKTQGQWRIRLWDENDQPGAWSEAEFETGLAQSDWQGVWVCPETEEPDIDCTDAINAFAKPNWEQKQAAKGRRSLISPTARQVICAKRLPLRREKASGCTLPLRDCMRHG